MQLIHAMETGETTSDNEEQELQPANLPSHEQLDACSSGLSSPSTSNSAAASSSSGAQPHSQTSAREKRKRVPRKESFLAEIVEEQRALRSSWEKARKEDLELAQKRLKLQEEAGKREQQLIDILNSFLSRQ